MILRNPKLEDITIFKEQERFKIIKHGDNDFTNFILRNHDFEILTEIIKTYCERCKSIACMVGLCLGKCKISDLHFCDFKSKF